MAVLRLSYSACAEWTQFDLTAQQTVALWTTVGDCIIDCSRHVSAQDSTDFKHRDQQTRYSIWFLCFPQSLLWILG
jgi:hypothetical protein